MSERPRISIIVPVYNRPEEVRELLQTLNDQNEKDFEVIIVEDGSRLTCESVCLEYQKCFSILYLKKENGGPGLARNFGAEHSSAEWIIFLDSDVLLPSDYIKSVLKGLTELDIDAFGGPDRAHRSFTSIQKAINYSMTSFFTTGGIRGKANAMEKFKPRSFNMGMKKKVFSDLNGFSPLRFGEDVDFSIRIEKNNLTTALLEDAYVFHKRRTSFRQFFKQIFNSGLARIVLNELHPGSLKAVHLLPFLFTGFYALATILAFWKPIIALSLLIFPFVIFFDSLIENKSIKVAFLSIVAAFIQLFAYGLGFLKAALTKYLLRRKIKYAYLDNFYD